MEVQGECHCGAIAYKATVDPSAASLCNCADCQTLSGSPFRASVPAKAENFHLLRGEPTVYIKTADSGRQRAQAFCGKCGTPIYASAPKDTPAYALRLGAVKQRTEIPAQKRIWCDSALGWAQNVEDLPANKKS